MSTPRDPKHLRQLRNRLTDAGASDPAQALDATADHFDDLSRQPRMRFTTAVTARLIARTLRSHAALLRDLP